MCSTFSNACPYLDSFPINGIATIIGDYSYFPNRAISNQVLSEFISNFSRLFSNWRCSHVAQLNFHGFTSYHSFNSEMSFLCIRFPNAAKIVLLT